VPTAARPAGPATPTVTVVIATRDRAALLARALRSVLAQPTPRLEVVVVDDGSRDRRAVVDVVRAVRGPVRLLQHGATAGRSAARNRGLAVARGAWVTFLDDRDLWVPDALTRQLDALAGAPGTGWCLGGAVVVDDRWRIRRVDLPPGPAQVRAATGRYDLRPRGGSVVLARTALVRELGGYDPRFDVLADWELRIRLASRADLACAGDPLAVQVRPLDTRASVASRREAVLLRELHGVPPADGDGSGEAAAGASSAWEGLTAGRPLTAGHRALGAALRAPRRAGGAVLASGPTPVRRALERARVGRIPPDVRSAAAGAVASARHAAAPR
jgi:hypothetical protein